MIKVQGGGAGTFTVETEHGDTCAVSESLTAYQAVHSIAPFIQVAIDTAYALGAKDALDRVESKPKTKSTHPKGDS